MTKKVVSSCTGTQRNETLTNCVTTPCMDMKTIGIPPCIGTPGQPHQKPSKNLFTSRLLFPVMQRLSFRDIYQITDVPADSNVFFTEKLRLPQSYSSQTISPEQLSAQSLRKFLFGDIADLRVLSLTEPKKLRYGTEFEK